MLITQEMLVKGALTQKIVNVALPSQQASKIIKELQASCNSPNKATQLGALKCWGAWIENHSPEEWDNDSVCHFAVRPLLTKKSQALHRDVDICKLKLNLLWELLNHVQGKMQLKGSQYILKIFFQSCFAWLSSIDCLDNEIIVLIIKLLLILLQKFKSPIICDTYTFSPIQIDDSTVRKFFHIFSDNILDVFDYWKKVQDNNLVLQLWSCFLEYCECGHENITTSIWHRIFKINQTFCLDHRESIKDRLFFLHACATNVKTVLLSSKYIKGESCFTTPCEALIKKLVEVCSTEVEELPDWKMFSMCKDVSEVLANESIIISDYEMCIYLIDYLEDFVYKSFFWGTWCGLVECFKKNLMNVKQQTFTRKQLKFYRKLRGVSVNFELDKTHLTTNSVALVQSGIDILKIECFCRQKIPNLIITNSAIKSENVFSLESMLCGVSLNGNFGKRPLRIVSKKHSLTNCINFEFLKNFFKILNSSHVKILITALFPHVYLPFFTNIKIESLLVEGDHFPVEIKRNFKMLTPCNEFNECESSNINCWETHKGKKVLNAGKEKKKFCVSKTQNKKKADEKGAEKTIKRKKRKSFEILIQEIVVKNKLRKSEKKTLVFEKRKLRSGKLLRDLKEEKVPKRQLRRLAKRKSPKTVNKGKLENFVNVIDSNSKSKPKNPLKKVKKNKKEKEKNESISYEKPEPVLPKVMGSKMFKKGKKNIKAEAKAKPKVEIPIEISKKTIVEENNLIESSPVKEALQDHKYAKPMESDLESSLDKQTKKYAKKKLKKEEKTTNTDLTDVKPLMLEKIETLTDPNKLKNQKFFYNEIEEMSSSEKIKMKASDEKIISDNCVEIIKEKNISDIESPKKSITKVKCENIATENNCFEIEEENVEKKNCFLQTFKRQMGLIYSPRPRKKAKFHEESLERNGSSEKENHLESFQVENNREILSPIKENSAENFALKEEEVSPDKKLPPFDLTKSSRTLRMMALIPKPSSPLGNQMNCEKLNLEPKTGSRHHFKKFIGVDKSSRASKMLARLSENMKQEGENLTNTKLIDENSTTVISTLSSPNFIADNVSQKHIKKKKFISFDDSKNETIVFQTDTPPAQILKQRTLLQDS